MGENKAFYVLSNTWFGVCVGSEFCLSCHEEYRTWNDTQHALSIRKPMARYSLVPGKGVVADYDRNRVDDSEMGSEPKP